MSEELYNLACIHEEYLKIAEKKNKKDLKSLEFILELNKKVGFDEILIREGYESYQFKNELQLEKNEVKFTAFFQFIEQNLSFIESSYLKLTNDGKNMGEEVTKNPKEYNFFLNKNSISKFIRDEAFHYQATIDKYSQKINEEEQLMGISRNKMHLFFIQLFSNKYTSVIRSAKNMLEFTEQELKQYLKPCIIRYLKETKQLNENDLANENYIHQDQLLDFLTFWLKEPQNQKLYVLYARTIKRLNKETRFLTSVKDQNEFPIHPSQMTTQQIIESLALDEGHLQKSDIHNLKISHHNLRSSTFQIANRQKKNVGEIIQLSLPIKNRQLTKQQLLDQQLKSLFEFGCKRRYALHKNITFDEIEQESKTMNLQKFINFCKHFEILQIIAKQLLGQYFKMFAINLRTIDYTKFVALIRRIIQTDERVIDSLLNKIKYDLKQKKKIISRDKKVNQLSNYKFNLKPINGKDTISIKNQLQLRKLQKNIKKEEKQQKYLLEKKKKIVNESRLTNNIPKSYSNFQRGSRLDPLDMQSIRDKNFNPQKLISESEHDKLWNAYQEKIWGKESPNFTLESILSKRIQRGNMIIQKIKFENEKMG